MSDPLQSFIKHAYLDKKIERFSASIVQNTQHEKNAMPAQVFNTYQKIMIRVFDPATLIKELKEIIVRRNDKQQMQQIHQFLLQPQVQEITYKEELAKSLQVSQAMQTFFTALQTTPPTNTRKGLIEQIDKAIGSSALVIEMQVSLFKAIAWGMKNVNPNTQNLTQEQLQQMALDMKEKMRQPIAQQIWMSMLFAYKNVSDDALQNYLTLNETPEGQRTLSFIRTVYSDLHQHTTKQLQYALEAEFD